MKSAIFFCLFYSLSSFTAAQNHAPHEDEFPVLNGENSRKNETNEATYDNSSFVLNHEGGHHSRSLLIGHRGLGVQSGWRPQTTFGYSARPAAVQSVRQLPAPASHTPTARQFQAKTPQPYSNRQLTNQPTNFGQFNAKPATSMSRPTVGQPVGQFRQPSNNLAINNKNPPVNAQKNLPTNKNPITTSNKFVAPSRGQITLNKGSPVPKTGAPGGRTTPGKNFADLGTCTGGGIAVAACFPGNICYGGYTCDRTINRCCSAATAPTPPQTTPTRPGTGNLGSCSWGQPAVAACFSGGFCGPGYQCDTSIQRCCLPRGGGTLGYCSWGQPAIEFCQAGNTCSNQQYQCDTQTNQCCLPNEPNPPQPPQPPSLTCQDGNPASTQCTNGLCSLGYICSTADNLCCLSGTSASCNFASFPTAQCNNGICNAGEYCSDDGYCCSGNGGIPPGGIPQPPTPGVCPFSAPSSGSCSVGAAVSTCPDDYACINNVCCLITALRCNDGVTTPTGLCVGGQCPQQLPDGTPALQVCEPTPYNLCCAP